MQMTYIFLGNSRNNSSFWKFNFVGEFDPLVANGSLVRVCDGKKWKWREHVRAYTWSNTRRYESWHKRHPRRQQFANVNETGGLAVSDDGYNDETPGCNGALILPRCYLMRTLQSSLCSLCIHTYRYDTKNPITTRETKFSNLKYNFLTSLR